MLSSLLNSRFRVAALAVAALTLAAWPPYSHGQTLSGRIEALDLPLPALPWLVLPMTWQGKPAIMVFSRGEGAVPGTPAGPRLAVFGVRGSGWVSFGEWALPAGVRWIEPLRLSRSEAGWLMLLGTELQAGRASAGGLIWNTLCTCPSLYDKETPEELGTRLARDLDGDGADEIVLPTPRGLAVYRLVPLGSGIGDAMALEPAVLVLWRPDGTPLAAGADIPELIPWQAGDGLRLLQLQGNVLVAYRLPAGERLPPLVLDTAARARAHAAHLPDLVREALGKVADGEYADTRTFADALGRAAGPHALPSAMSHFAALIAALRDGWKEIVPERAPLTDLAQRAEDRGEVLALEDVTGDGIPDLLHVLVRNEKQILKVESELRLFPGTSTKSLAFGAPRRIRAEGIAVGALLHPAPKEYALVVARAEVSLGALLRAKMTRQLDVETSIYPFGPDGLAMKPTRQAKLTLKGFEEDSQIIVLNADLTGTGHAALLMNLQPDAISVFFPEDGTMDLDRPTAMLTGPLPRKREETFVGDFQGEGRESVLLWYRGSTTPEARRRALRLVRWVPG